jgi:hypothetical protein
MHLDETCRYADDKDWFVDASSHRSSILIT